MTGGVIIKHYKNIITVIIRGPGRLQHLMNIMTVGVIIIQHVMNI